MPDEQHGEHEDAADAGEDRYAAHREKWRFWARALVRAGEDLRALLHVDESGYRFIAGTAHGAARDYYLYATLDEVEKLGIAVIGWDELIGTERIEPEDATSRVILERSLDEQSFWTRKTLEVLIDLACFSQTNEHAYYRHLLLLRDLRRHLSIQQDLTTFYGAPSRNVEWSINRVYEEIRELEADEIDSDRTWYARQPLTAIPNRPNGLLTSVRARLQTALPLMYPHEKLSVGLSYARTYGSTSEDIHFRPQATLSDINSDAVAAGIDRVAVNGVAVVKRIQELLGQVPEGINETLRDSFERNEYPGQVLGARTTGRAAIGEFVLAGGDLAEVVEVREGPFAYEVYKVNYLAERPLPGIDDDWFLAEHVERFYTEEQFVQKMREAVATGRAPADAVERIEALPLRNRHDLIRESLVATWEQAGLREWVRERQRQAATRLHPYAPDKPIADERYGMGGDGPTT
jgi:hypothetical protein